MRISRSIVQVLSSYPKSYCLLFLSHTTHRNLSRRWVTMPSSDLPAAGSEVDVEEKCHDMRLLTELRAMIYRPLLIARYAMTEHSMRSGEISLPPWIFSAMLTPLPHSMTITDAGYYKVQTRLAGSILLFWLWTVGLMKKQKIHVDAKTTLFAWRFSILHV